MDSISGRIKNNLSPKEVQTNDTALDKLYDRNYFTLNHKIASKKSMLLIALIIPFAVFFLGNFAFNCIGEALSSIAQRTAFHFSMSWFFVPPMSGGYFIVVIGLTVILEICVPYRLWSSYRDFNMHIKGSERWATMVFQARRTLQIRRQKSPEVLHRRLTPILPREIILKTEQLRLFHL